jgi:flavin-dependent dehydrogenase
VEGLFPVGDSVVRTNPLYGRGCSFAAVSAHLLRDALAAASQPGAQLLVYRDSLERELRPYYEAMRKADRSAIRRAEAVLTPGHRSTLRGRLAKSFLEDGVSIAMRQDVELLREFMRGFHMLEHPDAWLKRPANLAKIARVWARGRKRNADHYPAKAGPERDAMFGRVGVSATADLRPDRPRWFSAGPP